MKRLLTGIMLSFSLFLSGCGNEYLDNLDDIQTLVDGAYSRVNQFGVNLSILTIDNIAKSATTAEFWVPKVRIIPVDYTYLGSHVRKFTKNKLLFTYTVLNTYPNRYSIYQSGFNDEYYVIYNEPLAVEGIYSVVLKSKTGFITKEEAIKYALANLIPKLIFKSTTADTTIVEHVKVVSENFEIIEIFSPYEYTTSAEKIKITYPALLIDDLS